ncbi:MAG TPA: outer membrane lipoprotein chaperone LolA [Steroidobacteraceae bacterium]|jgi:outer membrane lipoprotein carrier protein|nr:outer membrane lipoprotein chaperone LolA [Steroidobacteraceae bacterium]
MQNFRPALAALLVLVALRSAPAPASSAHASPAHASAATEVEHYLDGLSSWSADFKQTIADAKGKVLRSAEGKFYLERPGKFRWDYSEPSEQLILADGKQIWFYDKDLAQANVRNMDGTLASTPAMLLSGTGSVSSEFDIKALPSEGGLRWFQLVPKHPSSDFQLVRIGFDRDGELASMFLADKLDQITQVTFTHPVKNPKLIPDLFTFTPPPGVDVIGRDAK